MGKVLLSTGAYAKTPYYLEGLGVRVYSAEELCYVLKEDAFFLDRSIVDRKLIRWIEEELMLPKLAAALYPFCRRRRTRGLLPALSCSMSICMKTMSSKRPRRFTGREQA